MRRILLMNEDGNLSRFRVTEAVARRVLAAIRYVEKYGYPKYQRDEIDLGGGRLAVFVETMGGGYYRVERGGA